MAFNFKTKKEKKTQKKEEKNTIAEKKQPKNRIVKLGGLLRRRKSLCSPFFSSPPKFL